MVDSDDPKEKVGGGSDDDGNGDRDGEGRGDGGGGIATSSPRPTGGRRTAEVEAEEEGRDDPLEPRPRQLRYLPSGWEWSTG